MNRKEILAMEVGEELDRLVATEVMGEPIPKFVPEAGRALDLQLGGDPVESPKGSWLCLCEYDKGDIPIWHPLPFSTDISAAWQVVEKMLPSCAQFRIIKNEMLKLRWQITFVLNDVKMTNCLAEADTVPEAICKAALLAKTR